MSSLHRVAVGRLQSVADEGTSPDASSSNPTLEKPSRPGAVGHQRRAGQETDYSYDVLDHVTRSKSADVTVNYTYTYTDAERLQMRTDGNQKATYTYDNRGDLASIATGRGRRAASLERAVRVRQGREQSNDQDLWMALGGVS